MIGGGRLNVGDRQQVSFRSTGNNVSLMFNGPFNEMQVATICTQYPKSVQHTYLVDISDKMGDRYRFGVNGQEKVNEIAGIGNHNTAEFWEYDTRIAFRWNLDPVIKPWESGYSTLGRSPLWKIDPKGNTDYYNQKGKIIYSTPETIIGDGQIAIKDDRIIVVVNDQIAERILRDKSISMLTPESQFELPPFDHRQEIKQIMYPDMGYNNKGKFKMGKPVSSKGYEVGGRGVLMRDGSLNHIRAEDGSPSSDGRSRRSVNPYNSTHRSSKYEGLEENKVEGGHKEFLKYVWHSHPESNVIETFVQEPSGWDIEGARIQNEMVISTETSSVYFYNSSSPTEKVYDAKADDQEKGKSGQFPEMKFYDVKGSSSSSIK